ncbi:MAG TPA: leucyl/phenylalanyl-tRNA--protein transferase, partial [Acidiferrobacteraceae bacterium]|nr:leucyl/phenylalanyl-tRNA--protein transferase [Acidiferrobacteraceae bacterium]
QVSLDRNFDKVIRACALPRNETGVTGTWITPEMIDAYCELHRSGIAHSVEAWLDDKLVGGLYGVALGKVFFGESMFSQVSNASKVAFVYLAKQLQAWDYSIIDCQLPSKHLFSLGAQLIRREAFLAEIKHLRESVEPSAPWIIDPALRVA